MRLTKELLRREGALRPWLAEPGLWAFHEREGDDGGNRIPGAWTGWYVIEGHLPAPLTAKDVYAVCGVCRDVDKSTGKAGTPRLGIPFATPGDHHFVISPLRLEQIDYALNLLRAAFPEIERRSPRRGPA